MVGPDAGWGQGLRLCSQNEGFVGFEIQDAANDVGGFLGDG